MGDARVQIWVEGRVQGVWFRETTRKTAESLSIRGFVRNLSDGRVEVVAEGPRPRLETLVSFCHEGPTLARVEHVECVWEEYEGDLGPFAIR